MEKKPFIVFKGAKRDMKRLNEEYQSKCIVASSDSGWTDEALTEQYCREVIGTFSFGTHRLLAWDAFRCHLTPRVNDILNRAKVDSVIIPGDCTKFIQAPDVSWNKPMKEYLRQIYDNCLAESEHQMTAHGNMKGSSRQQMTEWVLEARKKLPAEVIKKSFKVCALSSNLDGSEDDQITCIKHGPCQSLLPRLQAFHQEEEETDPYECTTVSEEEIAQEDVTHLILDEHDEDEILDIDIES